MPKIVRIINRLNIGGPTFNVAYLTKYLQPEFETLLVSGVIDETEASSSFILDELGIQPVYISDMKREINFKRDRKAYKQIKKIIQDFQPDIVHTHAAKSGALGRLAAANCNVPVILHTFHGHVFHSYFSPLKTRIFLEIERWLAKKSTRIIAISDIQKRELAEQFKVCPADKIEVIYNGFDLSRFLEDQPRKREQFRLRWNLQPDEIAIGIIGRIVPVKNHELFLQVMKNIQQKTTKKVKGIIIGDGEDRVSIENRCKELNLSYGTTGHDFLTFTSWIKEIDVATAGLDIAVLTSWNEGTPVSMIEAQAAGCPVVTTNVGGVADVVIDNQTGFLVPSNDVTAMTERLLTLIENDNLRQSMGQAGKQFVCERFTYQILCKNMSSLYWRLLNEQKR
ncbi:MAG: glycosyltransferase family 4 protein [Bacteroidia bacterium]|nr:glycosyltransferase family 4 protein [Bacteroidia bacterium]